MKSRILFGSIGLLFLSGAAFGADGAAIFKQKMCAGCHAAGKMGGDLAASKMDRGTMMEFLKNPQAKKPGIKKPAFKGSDEELGAVVDYALGLRKK